MKCKNHNESDSCYVCTVCGEPLCDNCTLEIGKSIYCSECLENLVQ